MHVGMIYLDGEKMSKSLGNMIFVEQVLQEHTADGLRLSVLAHHYREEYEPTEAEFEGADRLCSRMHEALEARSTGKGAPLDGASERTCFLAALEEDFNTPDAIDTLAKLADRIVAAVEYGHDVRPAQTVLRELAGLLGLTIAG
jgi:L-cysteine:1D-myo-inositol 2-amino-2-deoxy-alpha-D-glucopyranoside ligase